VSEVPDPTPVPRYVIDPAIPDTAPLTVGEARKLHKVMGDLAEKVDTFNARLAGGERRWAVLTGLSVVIVLVLGVVLLLGHGLDRIAHCQAQQSNAIRDSAVQSRSARSAADAEQLAVYNQLINRLTVDLDATSTPEQRTAAVQSQLKTVQEAKAALLATQKTVEDNPLPVGYCS
jgi:predicted metalloprotease